MTNDLSDYFFQMDLVFKLAIVMFWLVVLFTKKSKNTVFNIVFTFRHQEETIVRHWFICADRQDIELCDNFSSFWIGSAITAILTINQKICFLRITIVITVFNLNLTLSMKLICEGNYRAEMKPAGLLNIH